MKISIQRLIFKASWRAFVFFLFTVGSVSCGQVEGFDRAAVICPPDPPPVLGGSNPEYWNLSWLTDDGTVSSRRVECPEHMILTLARERPVILRAQPGTPDLPGSYRIRPAGCVIPAHREGLGDLELKWEDGFTADFLLRMASAGIDPVRININRFHEAVGERADGSPWTLNPERLGSDLVNGDLWIYSFRSHPVFELVLPLSSGSWYSSYPPDPVLIVEEQGGESAGWSGILSEGTHFFIRPSDKKAVTVTVDERGEAILLYDG